MEGKGSGGVERWGLVKRRREGGRGDRGGRDGAKAGVKAGVKEKGLV